MKDTLALPRSAPAPRPFLDAAARRIIHRSLERLRYGRLTLHDQGERYPYGRAAEGAPDVHVHVLAPAAYRTVVLEGTVGAGSAYMDGMWSTDDLPGLIRLFARNVDAMFELEGGLARLSRPLHKAAHFLRRNTRSGSRRNIVEHYDLGNDFYRLFLDETMAYSCGIFENETSTLRDASIAKFDRIAQRLALSREDHLLEIGTGWGGFALHAAERYGCRVTSTTISDEQYEHARRSVMERGLGERVNVVQRDYRDLSGQFDKIVSIEMIEAVGHQFLETFFSACSRLLRPDGVMALQSITIPDQEFDRHRHEVDFIKRYIFPGSCIPSVAALSDAWTRASDLRLVGLEDITSHYVTTLQHWRRSFLGQLDSVRALSFSERFIRMWDFYLSYCEGGFAARYLGNVQMVLAKPRWRPSRP